MDTVIRLMKREAIFVVPPMRLLRLAAGRSCETGCGTGVAVCRSDYGLFMCMECVVARSEDIQNGSVRSDGRLAYGEGRYNVFKFIGIYMDKSGDRCGPTVTFEDDIRYSTADRDALAVIVRWHSHFSTEYRIVEKELSAKRNLKAVERNDKKRVKYLGFVAAVKEGLRAEFSEAQIDRILGTQLAEDLVAPYGSAPSKITKKITKRAIDELSNTFSAIKFIPTADEVPHGEFWKDCMNTVNTTWLQNDVVYFSLLRKDPLFAILHLCKPKIRGFLYKRANCSWMKLERFEMTFGIDVIEVLKAGLEKMDPGFPLEYEVLFEKWVVQLREYCSEAGLSTSVLSLRENVRRVISNIQLVSPTAMVDEIETARLVLDSVDSNVLRVARIRLQTVFSARFPGRSVGC